jgi:hypothetical protein
MILIKRYKEFKLLEWILLFIFNSVLIYFTWNNSPSITIYTFITISCFIDLFEIKNIIKYDISIMNPYPFSFFHSFLEILLIEVLSLKLIPFIFMILFLYLEKKYPLITLLSGIFIAQIVLSIFLYHFAYRFTSYSIIIRYLFLSPMLLLFLGYRFLLEMDLNSLLKNNSIFFIIIPISLLLYISYYLTFKIISSRPFINKRYLEKVKETYWYW